MKINDRKGSEALIQGNEGIQGTVTAIGLKN